jgi:hypothetical protein
MSDKKKYPLTGFSKITWEELLGIMDMLNSFKTLGETEKELILLAMQGMKARESKTVGAILSDLSSASKITQCTNAIPTPNGAIDIKTITNILEFCYKNTGYMWADKIAGELLFCDFRDAKSEMERFFFKE